MSLTYKNLYQYVVEEINSRSQYYNNQQYIDQLGREGVSPLRTLGTLDAGVAELMLAIQKMLDDAIPAHIIEGLEISASDPISGGVIVSAGKGSVGGKLYTLATDMAVTIPFDDTTSVFYIVLYRDSIIVEKTYSTSKLTLGKVIVPYPGVTSLVQDTKDESWNAYIVNYTEYKLYGHNDKFEEDTIDLLRDNISPILADNIVGNLRLSENLKILNTAGTLELDSNSLKLFDTDENLLAKFNQHGTYFYDTTGVELAKFATDEAHLGNIKITKNSIQSKDYTSEVQGFKISDTGFAEFDNVRVRGRISSSVFEQDKISAVGGKLLVGNSSVLALDVTNAENFITVEDSVFSVNEILIIKDSTHTEYLQITSIASAPTYAVSRGLNGPAYTWNKGTAIISTGVVNKGYIALDAISDYGPFIDILYRDNIYYSSLTTKVRLGNLAGITDADFGGALSGFGLYAEDVYLKGCIASAYVLSSEIVGSTITGSTIQTGVSNPRTVFDSYSIASYDENGIKKFEVKDGSLTAKDVTLIDPANEDIYSYLSSGQWYFHDELGNITSYVKRLCQGQAATGATVVLCGWKSSPVITLSVKELLSYNSGYAESCQHWCVYNDDPQYFCTSATCYGYCFTVHAQLIKSGGVYTECIQDVAEGNSVYTHSDVICAIVKNKFIFWCLCSTCSTCYGYGTYCYTIKYRESGGSTWTCCDYSYEHPHSSTSELLNYCYACQTITFPGACCWEIQLVGICTVWALTNLSAVSNYCCCRTATPGALTCNSCARYTGEYQGSISDCTQLSGNNPDNVYCAYISFTTCSCSQANGYSYYYGTTCWYHCGKSMICIYTTNGCALEYHCVTPTWAEAYYNPMICNCSWSANCCIGLNTACVYTYIYRRLDAWLFAPSSTWGCAYSYNCITNLCLIQCYCSTPDNATCCFSHLYSTTETSTAQTILDPNGVINYIAIGYN